MTIREHLKKSIRSAYTYNPDTEVPPVCILWPDRERLWEGVVPALQKSMEELFIFGEYQPDLRSGTSLWIRCQVAKLIKPAQDLPDDVIPIIYLPGISRQELRIVQSCPEEVKLLIELQYRGKYWSQLSSKDWTPLAFLVSDHGGLSLDVGKDKNTKDAIQLCLPILLDQDVSDLKGDYLDAKYIYSLGVGDFPKAVLSYINEGETYITKQTAAQWASFCKMSESLLLFNPHADGYLGGAQKLAEHTGSWKPIWDRYREAPGLYPNIPDAIRACPLQDNKTGTDLSSFSGWPQYNDQEETSLQQALSALVGDSDQIVRDHLGSLHQQHLLRKDFIWYDLGMSPVLKALIDLHRLAEEITHVLTGASLSELAADYETQGCNADDAFLTVLATSSRTEIQQVVLDIARVLYEPWAEATAKRLQELVQAGIYPIETPIIYQEPISEGTCILFIDGLRYDIAQKLSTQLSESGYEVETHARWAAFPTLTSTGKPAITPVSDKLKGTDDPDSDFYPIVTETGKSIEGGYHLKKLLIDGGWSVLSGQEISADTRLGWTEISDLDHEGHALGWKLSSHIDSVLQTILMRIKDLFAAGWKNVEIVTDHGWLLLPGGLPKTDLPTSLTENLYGRCAQIKEGALTDVERAAWYWNHYMEIAYAPGIHAFKKGEEFVHGGISLQESRVLDISVTQGDTPTEQVRILDIIWKGLRCNIETDAIDSDLVVDIRLKANIPETSVALNSKKLKSQGVASLVVDDESQEGVSAYIVVLDSAGTVLSQQQTIIGE